MSRTVTGVVLLVLAVVAAVSVALLGRRDGHLDGLLGAVVVVAVVAAAAVVVADVRHVRRRRAERQRESAGDIASEPSGGRTSSRPSTTR
ncbi:hypothetical protein Q9R32_02070 [Actinotalea sp. AC32]|nr:hypothetical protein [Actinotalea sp. AC32]